MKKSKKAKKPSRISMVDLIRFICAVSIVIHHYAIMYYIDPNGTPNNARFRSAFVLVEIFLILSGFFVANHFKKPSRAKLETKFKTSVQYTLTKYKAYLPLVALSLILGLIYSFIDRGFSLNALSNELAKFPFELSFNSVFYHSFTVIVHNPVLWYLSATFIIFPIFCTLSNTSKKYLRNWLYFVFIIIYYTTFWSGDFFSWPALIRVFAGLALGQLLFDFVNYLKTLKLKKSTKIALQIVEIFCLWSIIDLIIKRGDPLRPTINNPTIFNFLLASFTSLSLLLSKQTCTNKIHSNFFLFLGKISLPLFIFHYPILWIMHAILPNLDYKIGLALSLSVSIAFSIMIVAILSYRNKRQSP